MKKMISFLRGVPNMVALERFSGDIIQAQKEAFNIFGAQLLQYQIPEVTDFNGFVPLKKILAERYGLDDDEFSRVVCTNGGMETITFLFKLFTRGSTIITEEATYDRVLSDAGRYGHRVVGVPITRTGVNLKEFKKALEKNNKVKIFYHIIYHQNPYGINASMRNIEAVAKLCKEHGVLYVCDIAYDELNYSGENNKKLNLAKPVFSNTCLVGSFTKTIAPGIKCGFGILPKYLMSQLTQVIANTRLNPNYPTQATIWRLIDSGKFDRNIEFLKRYYGEKMDALNSALEDYFPEINISIITGGFFALLELENVKDSEDLIERVKNKGVIITPANVYAPNSKKLKKKNFLSTRIAFPALERDEIRQGIKIIAEEYYKS